MAKRLTRLKISEVSSVDRGAGEGVRVMLFKRDAPSGVLEKILGETDLTIRKDGTIGTGEKIKKALADSLPEDCKNGVEDFAAVFCKSCSEIMASNEADKEKLLEKSYDEFVEALAQIAPEGSEEAVKAAALAALTSGEVDMDPKELEALKAQAKEAETLKAEVAKRDAEIAKRDAELAIAKLSAEHKAYAEKLSEAARAKFMAMSPEERDAAVKKSVEKRDEDPVFKAMNERIAKAEGENAELKKRLDAEEDAKEKVAFGKRAVEVYNQPEAFGETLRKAYKGDAAAQGEVEKVTLSLRRAAEHSALFKNFGTGGGNADSAKAQINAKAEELRKAAPTLSAEQAYAKTLMDPANKELAQRVRQEERQGL